MGMKPKIMMTKVKAKITWENSVINKFYLSGRHGYKLVLRLFHGFHYLLNPIQFDLRYFSDVCGCVAYFNSVHVPLPVVQQFLVWIEYIIGSSSVTSDVNNQIFAPRGQVGVNGLMYPFQCWVISHARWETDEEGMVSHFPEGFGGVIFFHLFIRRYFPHVWL